MRKYAVSGKSARSARTYIRRCHKSLYRQTQEYNNTPQLGFLSAVLRYIRSIKTQYTPSSHNTQKLIPIACRGNSLIRVPPENKSVCKAKKHLAIQAKTPPKQAPLRKSKILLRQSALQLFPPQKALHRGISIGLKRNANLPGS